MSLKHLIKGDLVTAAPTTSVTDVAMLMAQKDVGAVLVCEGDKPLGIVTDRDIVLRCVCEGRDTDESVEQIMTRGVSSVSINDGIYDVIEHMRDNEIRRVPVVDENGRAVALISFGDIFELLAKEISDLAAPATPEKKKIVSEAA